MEVTSLESFELITVEYLKLTVQTSESETQHLSK